MKLVVGYSYYNDLESIKNTLHTFVNDVDHVIAVDGKYTMREGEDYSSDGSTEYLQGFSNVILDKFTGPEVEKRNRYMEIATEIKADVLLVIDSDEYVVDADWELFKSYLPDMIQNCPSNHLGLLFYLNAKEKWTTYPRIILRPDVVRYAHNHYLFTVNGELRGNTRNVPYLEGIKLRETDEYRTEDYLKKTEEYQCKRVPIENEFIRKWKSIIRL